MTALTALACGLALAVGCSDSDDRSNAPEAAPAAKPGSACDLYASPRSTSRGDGSRARPYDTVRRLVNSLEAGQVGCLATGRFEHRGVIRLRQPGVTLRPIASGRGHAIVDGALWIMPRARKSRISRLRLVSHDPVYTIPLKIQADDFTLVANDITTSTSVSCVLIGSTRVVTGTVIERNRIRRCGRTGEHDHLIYVQQSRDAVIRDNLLTDNAGGWAVHLFPDADGTVIEHNVIDANQGGVIFAGEEGDTSDDNVVRENAITFSDPRFNVEASWSGGPEGGGNRAYRNCLYSEGPGGPVGLGEEEGFDEYENVVATGILYGDRDRGDFTIQRGAGCDAVLGSTPRSPQRLAH